MPATIWITGGKGFIGRHLARFAAGQGSRVLGIGHGHWPAEAAADWSYESWSDGEVESSNLSQLALVAGLPDTIFHLAGGSSVGVSFQNPHEDFTRTVETTARLLEWTRIHSPRSKIVAVSSAAVYGAGHTGAIPETAEQSPFSPYGFHKAMMESLCRSYGANFGLSTAIVRLFSVYGATLEKQLIWDLCGKLSSGSERVALGGTGNEVRDWLHISDAVRLLWLAREECSASGQAINGGTGVGTRIADIAELVRMKWGEARSIEFNGKVRAGDPTSLVANVSRATDLGFRPAVDLDRGMQETVAWFRETRSRSSRA
jgi:UDP-glucose 4-epimerase